MKKRSDFRKVTLNLTTSTYEGIAELYPSMPAAVAIRKILDKFYDDVMEKVKLEEPIMEIGEI